MGRELKTLMRRIEAAKKKLAKNRDEFRDIESLAAEFADQCDSALNDIESAIDTLSQYV